MASALMQAEEPSDASENSRIAGLESQILNSQEVIVRLNRELDSALLRITTLENVCSESQADLHDKRNRISRLNDEINEREEMNEHLKEELLERDEKLKTLNDIIVQLKQHIKQQQEQYQVDTNTLCEQCYSLRTEFRDTSPENILITDLHSQIRFDKQLRQLIVSDLANSNLKTYDSPQAMLDQYHKNERSKFHNLLQNALTSENISNLIDPDDVLFELLTHLNSLIRLKETLSHDSKQLQHICSLLHITDDNIDELIADLMNKRECIEYLRSKIDHGIDFTDYDLVKHVLHDYFNFQQQKLELQQYLRRNMDDYESDDDDTDNDDLKYARLLIGRCDRAIHVAAELNRRIETQENTVEELTKELDKHMNAAVERRKYIDKIVSMLSVKSTDLNANEIFLLDHIHSQLQSVYENRQVTSEENHNENQQLTLDKLTKQIHNLREEVKQRKDQLNQLILCLNSGTSNDFYQSKGSFVDDQQNSISEGTQFNIIHSYLQSSVYFCRTLSDSLSVENNQEIILQRIQNCQLIINELNWTTETIDEFMTKLKVMKQAETLVENLQQRWTEAVHHQQALANRIQKIANQFLPDATSDDENVNLTNINQLLETLTNFRQNLIESTQMHTDADILQFLKTNQENMHRLQDLLNQTSYTQQDAQSQTAGDDDFCNQLKELLKLKEYNACDVINKIKELCQFTSQVQIDELNSNNDKLRTLLNANDESHFVESVIKLKENFSELHEEYKSILLRESLMNKVVQQLMDRLHFSSDTSLQERIDELHAILDTFSVEYNLNMSADVEARTLTEMFKPIQVVLVETNRLKLFIDQLSFAESSQDLDYISKLQTYVAKVKHLCRLICKDDANIDQALTDYQAEHEHVQSAIETISTFKHRLLTRLSLDNEEQIFDRLSEMENVILDLKEKLRLQTDVDTTVASLNATISEQRSKLLEHEDTLEKLRAQRERMLAKMKEMKTNNETLTDQLKHVNQTVDDLHVKEIDYKNRIEEIEQQLRSANTRIQVSADECRTQLELQDAMKLEIESIKNEMDTQRKLYESRCRHIVQEKNQLDKNQRELFDHKQFLENENKRLQTILHTIKDTLENVGDVNSIVDAILKLRQDHLTLTNELSQHNHRMHVDNERLLLNIHQQQTTMDEYVRKIKDLETLLFEHQQQCKSLKQELDEKNNQYQHLQHEYHTYKEEYLTKTNSQVAIIDTEEPSPIQTQHAPIQQAMNTNSWVEIGVNDETIPLTTENKYMPLNTSAALLNLLAELKRLETFHTNEMPLVFRETRGDLFSAPSHVSLAHCVSRDMKMSKGIAVLFRDRFGRIEELKSQNASVGGCAYINLNDRFAFYLVTKELYYGKPTLHTLESSLRTMRDLCIQHNVHHLAMPRIGCGLDRLDWNHVSALIQSIFENDDMEITICSI